MLNKTLSCEFYKFAYSHTVFTEFLSSSQWQSSISQIVNLPFLFVECTKIITVLLFLLLNFIEDSSVVVYAQNI